MLTTQRRIARSLVTVIFLTLIQVLGGPILAPLQSSPSARAATFDSSGLILNWDVQSLASWSGSGTTMGDASMNASTGTLSKVGTAGYPTYTSATTKYMTISGNNANYNFIQGVDIKPKLDGYATSAPSMQNVSIFAWVYPTGNGIIVDETNSDYAWQDSQIEMADGKFSFRVWGSNEVISETATPLNYWYYVGLTYDYSTLTLKAYINGKQVGQQTNLDRSAPWESNSAHGVYYSLGRYDPTNLGSASGGNFRFGALQIYNRAISPASILGNYEYDLYWYGPTVGNPADKTQLVNRSETFTVTACAGMRFAATCIYKWEASSNGGTTWSTVGTSSTSYSPPALTASDNGKKFRVTATDPGSAGDVPESIRNYAVSTAATLTVQQPPGAETDSALSMNGGTQAQYASVATSKVLPDAPASPFTLEVWVNPTGGGTIFSQGSGSNRFYIKRTSGNLMYYRDGGGLSAEQTCGALPVNQWTHISLTWNGSNTYICYMNAIPVLATTVTVGATTIGGTIAVGAYSANLATTSEYFQGQIDEVRIYSTAHSTATIATEIQNYGSISDSDLLAYYDFNESTGTTIYNRKLSASSSTDLTITGSTTWQENRSVDTSTLTNYTVVKFERSYLTSSSGWTVPPSVSQFSTLIVGGGGGGGYNSGGGGSGGGVLFQGVVKTSGVQKVTVGLGGAGSSSTGSVAISGGSSIFGSTTVAGGNYGINYASGAAGGSGIVTSTTTSGAGGAGAISSSYSGTAGSAGFTTTFSGPTSTFAGGGGGGGWAAVTGGGAGGAGGGGAGGITNSQAGKAGTYATGGGGGGGSASNYAAGAGGSGVIIIRWITASKPTFTKPTTAYLNAGMTETFTTNVAQDSATTNLTRTFRWESSTTGETGTYSLIKQGTGAANAYFAWVPTDTSTSGPNFTYRVIVTDSDTAGLFIVDTSTPVYAVINRALVVTGSSVIGKAINVSRSETFTIALGTSTYRPTLLPLIPGITLDTSTAGLAVVRIGDTVTVGTYYETLTVIDSVSATIVMPLTIIVAPPPSLTASSDLVDTGTVLYLDAGNSSSLNPTSPTIWKDMSGRGLQANFPPSAYPVGTTSCNAPAYSSDYMGILNFATDTCGYVPNIGAVNLTNPYSYQAWIKRNGSMGTASIDGDYTSVIATPWVAGRQVGLTLHWRHALNSADYYIEAAVWGNPTWFDAKWATPIPVDTWIFVTVTFNGSAITLSVNNQTAVSKTVTSTIDKVNIDSGLIIGKRFDQGAGYYFNGSIASLRLYNRILTAAEITQNYLATKARFESGNRYQLSPSQKYGQSQIDTFTITSGYGSKVTTFAVGDRTGVDWDTSTVANQVKLSIQESLTAGTFYDTATVTDALGQSTYLPIKMVIAKADTITVTLRNPKTFLYTGSAPTALPDIAISGLVGSDTGTATRVYSAPASLAGAPETYTAIVRSSVVPVDVETYTVTGDTLTALTVGSLSNYEGVIYETSTLTITQAKQPALLVNYFGAIAGSSYTLRPYGGGGTGAYSETVTSGSSALNCSITGHVLSNASPSTETRTCNIILSRAASRNYFLETSTATIYFFAFGINQQSQTGGGATIGITGATAITNDPGQAPTITGLSTTTLSLASSGNFTITGAGFGTTQLTVKFWRNKTILVTSSDGATLVIPIASIRALAPSTGKVLVITANGIAVSIDTLTITP